MKNKIIFFTSFLLILIIVLMPAKFITGFIPAKSGVSVNGISGSVWSGKIEQLKIKKWSLENVTFDTHALSLITGSLAADLSIAEGDLQGAFSFNSDGEKNVNLNNATVEVNLSHFEQYIPFKGIELNGILKTRQVNLDVLNSKPEFLSGSTFWNNGAVTFNGKSWELGDFDILWSTSEDGSITGEIQKAKNVLDIQGSIKVSSEGLLEFSGSITRKVDKAILNAFLFFADGKPSNSRQAIKFKKKIW